MWVHNPSVDDGNCMYMYVCVYISIYIYTYIHEWRQNYLLLALAMDMAKVGGPRSVVKVCTSMLQVCVKKRVSARGWSPIGREGFHTNLNVQAHFPLRYKSVWYTYILYIPEDVQSKKWLYFIWMDCILFNSNPAVDISAVNLLVHLVIDIGFSSRPLRLVKMISTYSLHLVALFHTFWG